MKIAALGAGYWGRNIVRTLAELNLLHAVVDPSPTALESVKDLAKGARLTTHLDEVLSDPDINGVTIATPAETHAELADRVMDGPSARPVLRLRLEDGFDHGRINCFASGQGRIPITFEKPWVRVQAERSFGTGRARYNCTASSGQRGRFHWFSQLWIIR